MSAFYDYVIVGAGFTGSVLARELKDHGKKVLVIDKRNHIGGNCYDIPYENFHINQYGGHIFHTNNDHIWNYVNKFSEFNQYKHKIIVNYGGELYSFPINLMTFYQLGYPWMPEDAKIHLDFIAHRYDHVPINFEEKALSLVGEEIYYKFFYGYTKKQWGREPKELPASLISRVPIRFSFDDNYYSDKYQGMPSNGYAQLFDNMLNGIPVELTADYLNDRSYYDRRCNKIIFTGEIDKFYEYTYGPLEYRSLRFEFQEGVDIGVPTMNYTNYDIPYTRQVSFGHFYPHTKENVIMTEYPQKDGDPYYPVLTRKNNTLYEQYANIDNRKVIFAGRLGSYQYLDMHQAIGQALHLAKGLLNE